MEKDIFCKMIAGEIKPDIVMEDKEWIAINDIHPQAPTHILIIPKEHLAKDVGDIKEEDAAVIGRLIMAAHKVAEKAGIAENGYRIIINKGKYGGQTISHLHIHLLGGRQFKEDSLV